jgi:hypothetical protein
LSSRPFSFGRVVVALSNHEIMKATTRNPNISLSILLCAVTLHWLSFTGFAQSTNQVVSLNGSTSYVSIPSAPDLQNATEITVEAWIYPTNTGTWGYFIIKGDAGFVDSARSYELKWVPGTGNNLEFSVFLGESTWADVGASAPAGQWVHFAGTYNSTDSVLRIYTNGVLVGETTTDASGNTPLNHQLLRQTTLPLVFGAELTHPMGFAAGCMDEVRIWNKARTQAEIAGSRFCRLSGSEANPAGYWNFDDGTANDVTGHGHNGTFAGNAQAVPIVGSDAVHAGVCGAGLLPRTATASAVVTNGFIIAATITDGGYGYTNTPTVRIVGGGGSGAEAVAVVSNGVVTSITVTNAGSGYTSAPVIVIEPPFIPNPVLGIAPMSFLSFSNLTLGGVYQLQQSVGWYWSNQPVSFTATNAFYTQMVAGVAGSGDYRLALNPVPAQAFATAVVNYGFVVHATVTSGGSGYVTSPAVTIVGGGGTNATAVAQISGGVVTNITITSNGTGYTNTPTVEISPPPAAAVSPTVSPVMRLDSASLAPYDNYQIQFEPDLGGTWGNWNGGLFSPSGVTNSQYLFITNGVGFFRLQYVP